MSASENPSSLTSAAQIKAMRVTNQFPVGGHRIVLLVGLMAAVLLAGAPVALSGGMPAQEASPRLSNEEFWKLVTDFSEPDGTFRSDNLVSNEQLFPYVMSRLVQVAKPGRAYVGVGPEQNFTYIAAIKPNMAFIVDIRRGNMDLHLMYKALFELSSNRVDFVSRLFSRPQPASLATTSTVSNIFTAYAQVSSNQTLYTRNLQAIEDQLTKVHGFALASNDFKGIEFVYQAMFTNGPGIHYETTTTTAGRGRGRGRGNFVTYSNLMVASDTNGHQWSYLADEDSFRFLKDFETRNLVVPVIGDFGGPKALRAVASYLREKQEIVSAFYVSNVEQYLRQDNIETNFMASAATMPVDESSVFIRASRAGILARALFPGVGLTLQLDPMATNAPATPNPAP